MPTAAEIRCTSSGCFSVSSAIPRSLARLRPDELEARVLLLEQKIAQLENRLKLAESEIGQDVDLAQVMVKPEDTAGVPSGWGKKGGP